MGRSQEFSWGAFQPPVLRDSGDHSGTGADEKTFDGVESHHDDKTLAYAAGFNARHSGYSVTRYPDEKAATVRLWKD